MQTNGERRFVARLPIGAGTVIDVGANSGTWTSMLLAEHPKANVHCFEPSAAAFARLRDGLDDRAALHQIALSDKSGWRDLHTDHPGSELASFYTRSVVDLHQKERVTTRRLDIVCAELDVQEIALLKIDTEGHDLSVLRGAGSLLDGHVRAIQFEYGGTALDTRVFLRDFFDLLNDRYRLYRLWRHGMSPANTWHESLEIATYQNWVAIHRQGI